MLLRIWRAGFILSCQMSSFLMVTSHAKYTQHIIMSLSYSRYFFFSFVFYFFFKCLTIWCSRFVLRKMFGKVKQTAFSQIFNSSLNEEKENNFLFRWKKKSWRKTTIKLVFSRNFSTLWWLFFFHSHIKRVQSMSWWLTNIYRKKKCCSYLPKRCTFFGGDLPNIPLY